MSKVIVFGGTGRTGRLIAQEAARQGHQVTIAARRPELLSAVHDDAFPHRISSARVDVTDATSVVAAVREQDAIVLAVSTPARHPGGLYSEAARNITAAARPGTRVIAISSGGVYRDDPALPFWFRRFLIPFVMNDLYTDMRGMETVIRDSPLDWTIVRASYLGDSPATGTYRVGDGATPPRGWKLSRADLARFTVDQLRSDDWLHKTPTLAN